MTSTPRSLACRILAGILQVLLLSSALPSQQSGPVFRAETQLVLVNVTVRDKKGNFVRNLKPEDFVLLEDNKPQKIASFDLESTDTVVPQDVVQARPTQENTANAPARAPLAGTGNDFKDRRLIVLFFDLSAMEPDEIE